MVTVADWFIYNYLSNAGISNLQEGLQSLQEHYKTKSSMTLNRYMVGDGLMSYGVQDFTAAQLAVMEILLNHNLDITLLLNPALNEAQMMEIFYGLFYNKTHDVDDAYIWLNGTPGESARYIDVASYADPSIPAEEMATLRTNMQNEIIDVEDDYEE